MSFRETQTRTVVNWKEEEAVVVDRAARSSGLPVASFVRAAALRTARQILAEAPTIEALHAWITDGMAPMAPPGVLGADDGEQS